MLRVGGFDGIIAVTPVQITAEISQRIARAGIPLLMEKPLGLDLAEAEQVVKMAKETRTPVMVGMNRRFDPVWHQAASLIHQSEHKPAYLRYAILRPSREENGFISDVCIHAIDWIQSVIGLLKVQSVRQLEIPGEGIIAEMTNSNIHVVLECLPTVGSWNESILAVGDTWTLNAEWGQGLSYKVHKQPAIQIGPSQKGESTWRETLSFIDALRERTDWTASPAEVFQAMLISQDQLLATSS